MKPCSFDYMDQHQDLYRSSGVGFGVFDSRKVLCLASPQIHSQSIGSDATMRSEPMLLSHRQNPVCRPYLSDESGSDESGSEQPGNVPVRLAAFASLYLQLVFI